VLGDFTLHVGDAYRPRRWPSGAATSDRADRTGSREEKISELHRKDATTRSGAGARMPEGVFSPEPLLEAYLARREL
jgi:hypothetical protein